MSGILSPQFARAIYVSPLSSQARIAACELKSLTPDFSRHAERYLSLSKKTAKSQSVFAAIFPSEMRLALKPLSIISALTPSAENSSFNRSAK